MESTGLSPHYYIIFFWLFNKIIELQTPTVKSYLGILKYYFWQYTRVLQKKNLIEC